MISNWGRKVSNDTTKAKTGKYRRLDNPGTIAPISSRKRGDRSDYSSGSKAGQNGQEEMEENQPVMQKSGRTESSSPAKIPKRDLIAIVPRTNRAASYSLNSRIEISGSLGTACGIIRKMKGIYSNIGYRVTCRACRKIKNGKEGVL